MRIPNGQVATSVETVMFLYSVVVTFYVKPLIEPSVVELLILGQMVLDK